MVEVWLGCWAASPAAQQACGALQGADMPVPKGQPVSLNSAASFGSARPSACPPFRLPALPPASCLPAHPAACLPARPLPCRDMAMAPFFGNSVACRIAEAHEIKHSTLVLGDWRAAQRIEFFIGRNGEPAEEEGEKEAGEAPAAKGHGQAGKGWRQAVNRRAGGSSGSAGVSTGWRARGGNDGDAGSAAGSDGEHSVVTGVGGFKIWVVNTHVRRKAAAGARLEAAVAYEERAGAGVGGRLPVALAGVAGASCWRFLCSLPASPAQLTDWLAD